MRIRTLIFIILSSNYIKKNENRPMKVYGALDTHSHRTFSRITHTHTHNPNDFLTKYYSAAHTDVYKKTKQFAMQEIAAMLRNVAITHILKSFMQ